MLKINNGVIQLTRGDDCVLDLQIYTPDNQEYSPREGEKARFTVRKHPLYNNATPPLIEKDFEFVELESASKNEKEEEKTKVWRIKIKGIDTKFLTYGGYLYDVQFCDIKGNITTVCKGKFILTYEIG